MNKSPKILMVWPKNPISRSNLQYSVEYAGCKTYVIPYGLCSVAGHFPKAWNLQLVDMNVEKLMDPQIEWADYVFVAGTVMMEENIKLVTRRVANFRKPVVLAGNYVTFHYERIKKEASIQSFCLGECEPYIEDFIADVENGTLKKKYGPCKAKDELIDLPLPRLELIKKANLKYYLNMGIQISKGCINRCEFCSVKSVYGFKPRYKKASQVIAELDLYYKMGWRGYIWIIDDNFISHINSAKRILTELIDWQKKHDYPFIFSTLLSINLAEHDDLIEMFLQANLKDIFIGIESVNEESLKETHKLQNIREVSIEERVFKLVKSGFHIMGGLILGFDNDSEKVFDEHIEFVNKMPIPWCDIYVLKVLNFTDLYHRMEKEDRLHKKPRPWGEHSLAEHYGVTNFKTKLSPDVLQKGYARVVKEVNAPKNIYDRLTAMIILHPKKSIEHLPFFSEKMNLLNFMSVIRAFIVLPNRLYLLKKTLELKRKDDWRFYRFFYNVGLYYNNIVLTRKIQKNISRNRVDKYGQFISKPKLKNVSY